MNDDPDESDSSALDPRDSSDSSDSRDDEHLIPKQFKFLEAVSTGKTETVKALLADHRNEIDVNVSFEDTRPPLYKAISANPRDLQMVGALLMAGADPNNTVQTTVRRTIFQHVVFDEGNDKRELVNLFLCHAVDHLAKDGNGYTALGIAVEREDLAIAKDIVVQAMVSTDSEEHRKFYQLCLFVANDDLNGARELLKEIEDVDFEDMDELKPMRFAIKFDKLDFVKLFIDFKNKKN